MASGAVIDLQEQFRHQPVIPAQTLGVHKRSEIRILHGCLVGTVQQFPQNRFPDLGTFVFVSHSEIRGKIQPIGIFPEQITAKTVNCGDFRQKQPLHLLLQMPVIRFLSNPLRKFCGNLTAKLRSRSFCIGYDQKFIQICRIIRIRQIFQQTVNQNFRLAGAGCRTDQELTAPVADCLRLLGCQLIRHGFPSPFRSPPRTAGRS